MEQLQVVMHLVEHAIIGLVFALLATTLLVLLLFYLPQVINTAIQLDVTVLNIITTARLVVLLTQVYVLFVTLVTIFLHPIVIILAATETNITILPPAFPARVSAQDATVQLASLVILATTFTTTSVMAHAPQGPDLFQPKTLLSVWPVLIQIATIALP